MNYREPAPWHSAPTPWWGRVLTILTAAVAGVVLFMLSMMVFVALLAIGLGFAGYLWWKTRGMRHALREQTLRAGLATAASNSPNASTVIEGEYVRLDSAEPGRPNPDA